MEGQDAVALDASETGERILYLAAADGTTAQRPRRTPSIWV
jgi:hypothetical protein